jgi:hypothetical protein
MSFFSSITGIASRFGSIRCGSRSVANIVPILVIGIRRTASLAALESALASLAALEASLAALLASLADLEASMAALLATIASL